MFIFSGKKLNLKQALNLIFGSLKEAIIYRYTVIGHKPIRILFVHVPKTEHTQIAKFDRKF